jgi:hypothetical protein
MKTNLIKMVPDEHFLSKQYLVKDKGPLSPT